MRISFLQYNYNLQYFLYKSLNFEFIYNGYNERKDLNFNIEFKGIDDKLIE